jgi:dephospho-CoA kinase
MSFILGLTGSIGMGKSTTAQMFRDRGVPVWDADAAVHRLYAPGGAAVAPVAALVPAARAADGGIDRAPLRAAVAADPGLIDRLNAAVHPLVAADRAAFLAATDAPLVVLDIPLLFEAGGAALCDAVAVVSTRPEVQRARVLARGLSEAEFRTILSRQMPDADKRARADYLIDSTSMEAAQADVDRILTAIATRTRHA